MNDAAHHTHGRILASGFRPAPGMAGPHRQTLAASVWPVLNGPQIHRERWELPDGDFTDIDWVSATADNTSWALVLPGILGNIRSPYVRHLLARLSRAGYHAGMLNHRFVRSGCDRGIGDSGETRRPTLVGAMAWRGWKGFRWSSPGCVPVNRCLVEADFATLRENSRRV